MADEIDAMISAADVARTPLGHPGMPLGNLGAIVDADWLPERAEVNTDGYAAAIAGAETAQDACDRLKAAGHEAVVQDESLVINGGELTASPFEGINQIGDHFFLWCVQNEAGELAFCVARGPKGSCPPRH